MGSELLVGERNLENLNLGVCIVGSCMVSGADLMLLAG